MIGLRHLLLRVRLRWARWRADPPSVEGVFEGRASFEEMGRLLGTPERTELRADDADGVPVEWSRHPHSDPGHVVFYLHGGAFSMGSVRASRHGLALFTRAAGATGFNVEYRLAPEHPFPAGLEDAVTAYRWLLAQGVPPDRITVLGESAGAGLALAMLLALRDAGDPLPTAAAGISTWADLDMCAPSYRERARRDVALTPEGMELSARLYVDGHDPRDPLVSPVHARLRGLPPLLLLVGTEEIVFDDTVRIAEKVRAGGGDVEVRVGHGMMHCWTGYVDHIRRAADDVEALGRWLRDRVSR